MRITAVGTLHLRLSDGRCVCLRDMLAVDGLKRVILSLSSADSDGWTSNQAHGAMLLKSPDVGELRAKVVRGLYAAKLQVQPPSQEHRVYVSDIMTASVYGALGHASKARIARGALAVPFHILAQAKAAARRNAESV